MAWWGKGPLAGDCANECIDWIKRRIIGGEDARYRVYGPNLEKSWKDGPALWKAALDKGLARQRYPGSVNALIKFVKNKEKCPIKDEIGLQVLSIVLMRLGVPLHASARKIFIDAALGDGWASRDQERMRKMVELAETIKQYKNKPIIIHQNEEEPDLYTNDERFDSVVDGEVDTDWHSFDPDEEFESY